ncbi:hypothetical protein GLYMA_09G284551v4 [Glycine max]|nr:hypothetical protein GLYMA_09G284251v4 [Glycine max]KAG4389039.1 hypothetical protein GLYMA_09G284551v4 [Glycine max]KAH1045274.1 hypothetical protein GYH30_026456 [Glycine max]
MTILNWSLCHWLLLPLPLKQPCALAPPFSLSLSILSSQHQSTHHAE